MPINNIVKERAKTLYKKLYPYRDALEFECPADVKLALLVNRWPNPWAALQELSKSIPFKVRKTLEAR